MLHETTRTIELIVRELRNPSLRVDLRAQDLAPASGDA